MNETLIGKCVGRRRRFLGFDEFAAFWHIAAMDGWRDVVQEQKAVCDAVGLKPRCVVLGDDDAVKWVAGIGLGVVSHDNDIKKYETPTLDAVHQWCLSHRGGAVLYFHTKGVSDTRHVGKKYWRWLMMQHVVSPWKENLKRLEIADIVGVNWQDCPNHPHFSGNFWLSRADWISESLSSPQEHRARGGPWIAGNPWERMHAEVWLGSAQWHIVDSLACRNEHIWEHDARPYEQFWGLTPEDAVRKIIAASRPTE